MKKYQIGWWNVENFDVEGSNEPSERLQKTLSTELRGWNEDVLETKIANSARMIALKNKTGKRTDTSYHRSEVARPSRPCYVFSFMSGDAHATSDIARSHND